MIPSVKPQRLSDNLVGGGTLGRVRGIYVGLDVVWIFDICTTVGVGVVCRSDYGMQESYLDSTIWMSTNVINTGAGT